MDGPANYDLSTTDTLAYTTGMYNYPGSDHEEQNLDLRNIPAEPDAQTTKGGNE